jgi:hypothetical protein
MYSSLDPCAMTITTHGQTTALSTSNVPRYPNKPLLSMDAIPWALSQPGAVLRYRPWCQNDQVPLHTAASPITHLVVGVQDDVRVARVEVAVALRRHRHLHKWFHIMSQAISDYVFSIQSAPLPDQKGRYTFLAGQRGVHLPSAYSRYARSRACPSHRPRVPPRGACGPASHPRPGWPAHTRAPQL